MRIHDPRSTMRDARCDPEPGTRILHPPNLHLRRHPVAAHAVASHRGAVPRKMTRRQMRWMPCTHAAQIPRHTTPRHTTPCAPTVRTTMHHGCTTTTSCYATALRCHAMHLQPAMPPRKKDDSNPTPNRPNLANTMPNGIKQPIPSPHPTAPSAQRIHNLTKIVVNCPK